MPLPVLLAWALPAPAWGEGLDVLVSGNWSETLGAGDLTGGAGSDLVGTVSSGSSQVSLDVASASSASDTWRIDIRRTTGGWAPGVRLWLRRSSNGSGPGSVSGGTSWQEITALDTASFSGAGDRTDVGLEFRITGLTVGLPPDLRTTTVTYTVVDL